MLPSIQTKACVKIFEELCQKAASIVIRFLVHGDITMWQLFSLTNYKDLIYIKKFSLKTCF